MNCREEGDPTFLTSMPLDVSVIFLTLVTSLESLIPRLINEFFLDILKLLKLIKFIILKLQLQKNLSMLNLMMVLRLIGHYQIQNVNLQIWRLHRLFQTLQMKDKKQTKQDHQTKLLKRIKLECLVTKIGSLWFIIHNVKTSVI